MLMNLTNENVMGKVRPANYDDGRISNYVVFPFISFFLILFYIHFSFLFLYYDYFYERTFSGLFFSFSRYEKRVECNRKFIFFVYLETYI